MIHFDCPHCGKSIRVKPEAAGKKGKCPGCSNKLVVPHESNNDHDKPKPVRKTKPHPKKTAISEPVSSPQPFAIAPQSFEINTDVANAGSTTFQPSPTTAVQVNINESRAAHSLGISSLVLGILCFFTCWIPFIGFPLSLLGLLLGGIGLFLAVSRKGSGIGYAIAGTAVNGIAFLLCLVFITLVASMFNAVDATMNEIANPKTPKQATPVTPKQTTRTTPNKQPSVPSTTKDTTPKEPAWTKADTPLALGDVQLRITSVTLGKVPLKRIIVDRDGVSEDVLLAIWLDIRNVSDRKKIDYRGWMSDYASLLDLDVELVDDADNTYRKISFTATLKVKDTETNASIYPGKSIKDAVVFEAPIEGVKYLRLKLAAKGCGEKGEFRFEIPSDMIRRQ